MTGVYLISRRDSSDCYVGSSQNVRARWAEHCRQLRRGNHACVRLQRSWNKYGEDMFQFSMLETCGVTELLVREQHFIDSLSPSLNTALYAGAPMRGRKQSKQFKDRMSQRMTGNSRAAGIKHTDQWKAERAAEMRGKAHSLGYRHTDEARRRISEAMKGKRHAKGAKLTPEALARRGAAIKLSWTKRFRTVSPETRAKIAASLAGRQLTAEHRQRISIGLRSQSAEGI